MILAHRIKPNDTSRIPRRFLWLDTESVSRDEGGKRVQSWRMGVTAYDGWDERKKERRPVEWVRHQTPNDLAQYINVVAKSRSRLVLCAHNLGFDLRIATLFTTLSAERWSLSRLTMTDKGTTARWTRPDGASIVAVDSYAWIPKSLANIGVMVGQPKLPDPAPDDEEGWWQRCTTDVNIMRAAMLHLVNWVEDDDLGTWQKTGAAMAWTVWRHRHLGRAPIVHDDPELREIERGSTYCGRTEAWKHGLLRGRRWVEMDLPLAYARVCRDTDLPVRLRGRVVAETTRPLPSRRPNTRRLYHANILTEVPVLPFRDEDGIRWPVGNWAGWYWDDELAMAEEYGASVLVGSYAEYSAAPALASFADWCIDVVEGTPGRYTEVQRTVVKHWSRAIVGKMGARFWQWHELGPTLDDATSLEKVWNADETREERLMTCAGRAWWAECEDFGPDALPAIQSAVISECRIRLWRIMNAAGLANVAYVDTDSAIVNVGGYRRLQNVMRQNPLWGLREKRSSSDLAVYGPRQLVWDGRARFAGVPLRARRTDETVWVGERWESLAEAVSQGRTDVVVTFPAVFHPEVADARRLHVDRHMTEAVRVGA